MNTENNPNILVVRLSSLGDIVLSSPVYKNIKAAWPNARVTLLVKPAFSQALAGHPDIDEILIYATPAATFKDKEQIVGYTGKSAGVSVRVAKGVTVRSGGTGSRW